jgi:hypothetical protein
VILVAVNPVGALQTTGAVVVNEPPKIDENKIALMRAAQELKEREIEEKSLGIFSIDQAKEELLDKISQMYGLPLEEVKIKYSEISLN